MTIDEVASALEGFQRLPRGWDSYGAEPIAEAAIDRAGDLAVLFERVFGLPSAVVPTPGGGVQLEYESPDEGFLEVEVLATGRCVWAACDRRPADGCDLGQCELTESRWISLHALVREERWCPQCGRVELRIPL